jgi:predicted DCC family thiol-disulfide oxidoreductase YuxK
MVSRYGHEPTIFFFDGVCGLCSRNVDFLLRRDKKKSLKFAALQDPKALDFLKSHGLPEPDFSTSILYHKGRFYFKSDNYLIGMKLLGFPWSLLSAFLFVPRFVRDKVYDFIAARRHKVFGKLESCRVPTPEERERFL